MKKKLLFVFNPHAGKSKIKTKLVEILDIFVKAGYQVTVYPTQGIQDGERIVEQEGTEYDLVVCSGGDGTLNEVVTGMLKLEKRIPIGYIPTGTTNDYAKSVGIPKGMIKAAQVTVSGTKFHSDIGLFNERTFVYIAAFGVFTDVSYQTKQEMKNAIGHTAYIIEGMKRLATIKSYYMTVKIDDNVLEDEFIYGMVTNSISVGGFKNLTGKQVLLDDGLFEVVFVRKPQNPIELQEIMTAILLDGVQSESVCAFKAKKVIVEAKEEIPWTLDGEFGGDHKNVIIKNQECSLEIMVDHNNIKLSSKSISEIEAGIGQGE